MLYYISARIFNVNKHCDWLKKTQSIKPKALNLSAKLKID